MHTSPLYKALLMRLIALPQQPFIRHLNNVGKHSFYRSQAKLEAAAPKSFSLCPERSFIHFCILEGWPSLLRGGNDRLNRIEK